MARIERTGHLNVVDVNGYRIIGSVQEERSTIAVAGDFYDWAAYDGPREWNIAEVLRNGRKLTRDEAAEVFPLLNPARYRK